jgi:UDP-N-acetylglucosamine transferase subunit ALG13
MIFVTVGNATQGFPRLLDAVDHLAGDGILKGAPVIIQSGNNKDFRASYCVQHDFLSPEDFRELISSAEVVICHGGAGTLHDVFQVGKTPVVMPRRRKYGEHIDDQLELVRAVAGEGRVIPAFEPEDLPNAILEAMRRKRQEIPMEPAGAIALISEAIRDLTQTC